MANLRALAARFPIYTPLGFLDSVDVADGAVAGTILALDQGMILAAIANELAGDAMRHAFSDGTVEEVIRPLIAAEEFSAGLPGPVAAAAPARPPAGPGVRDYIANPPLMSSTTPVTKPDEGEAR
jgi:hypothetical protein